MDFLQRALTAAADAAFGPVTIILILGTGLYLTFGLRFLTIRRLPETLRMLFNPALRGQAQGGGEVSPLGALMTGLSAMLGTGKIVPVEGASADEKRKLFRDNAIDFYRLDRAA